MFLVSMFLIVAGAVIMEVYYNPGLQLEFGAGLFITMAGIILWAVSLNYGPPPATKPLPPLDASATTSHSH